MTLDEAIRDLAAEGGGKLPRAAMDWALGNWQETRPVFLDRLERYASGEERSEQTREALFLIVHLLAEKRETRAFPVLCRLMRDAEACEAVLGDAITETLKRVIVSTYDGDVSRLRQVIEDPAVDEFVRGAALPAMAYLTRSGRIAENEMRACLDRLHAELEAAGEDGDYLWVAWVETVALLGYEDLVPLVEQAFAQGFVHPGYMDLDDFREDLGRTLGDPTGMAGFVKDHVGPFEDAIATFSGWYFFTEKYTRDQARLAANKAARERLTEANFELPAHNPVRHVGRNDPCPCGSGKKYKKCCLDAKAVPIPLLVS